MATRVPGSLKGFFGAARTASHGSTVARMNWIERLFLLAICMLVIQALPFLWRLITPALDVRTWSPSVRFAATTVGLAAFLAARNDVAILKMLRPQLSLHQDDWELPNSLRRVFEVLIGILFLSAVFQVTPSSWWNLSRWSTGAWLGLGGVTLIVFLSLRSVRLQRS